MKMRSWIRELFTPPVTRTIRKTPRRVRLALEALEDRCVLSTFPVTTALHDGSLGALGQANLTERPNTTNVGPTVVTGSTSQAVPDVVPFEVMGAQGKLVPLATPGPTGYTPQQLQTAYGLNQVSFSGIKGDGAGQTIALVDAYDNPSFVNSTDPNFNTSALHIFDQTFGLPDPPSFTKVNQNGQATPLPAPNYFSGWGTETALDIEWAHAMAPAASIILVEANSQSASDLLTAVATAGKLTSVVSMSWGSSENSGQLSLDSTFQVPGVTFLAGTGDNGAPGQYPAFSPHVVAVGGTSLYNLDSNGDYPGTGTNGEVGWSLGSDSYNPYLASGGGISQFETEPSYQIQSSVQFTGYRTIPDISADADPSTGVPIYDPFNTGTANPWSVEGGTSVSTPMMAGMVAMADQGRLLSGGQAFNSDQVLADLYSLDSSNPSDFHDILHGNNGFNAGPGYDYVTGLGTPNGSQLVPDLAYFGLSSRPTLTSIVVAPSTPSVDEGFTQQFTAMGTFASGVTQNITSSVVWTSATPSVATINAAGLATTQGAGTSVITASLDGVTSSGVTLTSVPLVALAVAPNNPSVPVLLSDQFTVTGTYSDGSTHDFAGTSVAWASSTPTVATINSAGLATAHALGTSVITASQFGVTSPGDVFTAVAPTFVVNTTADDLSYTGGKTSLREAILAANAYPGHTITFDPGVFATAQTITLTLGQLELTDTTGTEAITGPAAGVTVSGNNASRVFQVDGMVTASISGLTITGGNPSGNGGGVNNYGSLALTNCTVSGNSAFYGGGVNNHGSLSLTNCTVSGNSAGKYGSGGMDNAGALALTNCTVSGNSSYNYGSLSMTNCTVSGNGYLGVGNFGSLSMTNCTGSGNGIFVQDGIYGHENGSAVAATLTNCTVSGSFIGLRTFEGGSLALANCTVADNKYGVETYGGGTVTLGNTIVAGNTTADVRNEGDLFHKEHGLFISQGNNLIGATGNTTGWVASDLTGTNDNRLNPVLAPLGNYGGPTQTMALLPGSPALDAGSNALIPVGVTTDERGLSRIVNGVVDIGAFESRGFKLTVVPGGTPQTATIGTAFANPLGVTVTANNSMEPVNGGVVRFVAHPAANGASAFIPGSPAVISGGMAAVTASPNNADGSYQVVASATGSSASFNLTNVGPVFTSLVVNTTSDSLSPGTGLLSLPEAIAFANADILGNSSITFDKHVFAKPQTITLTGSQLELSNTSEKETITGPKAGVTVSGNNASRVFQVDTSVSASITGLTITGGTSNYGGGVQNDGSLTLTNCTVSGNSASKDGRSSNGGGVANSGTLALTNCTVSGNYAGFGGGGVVDNSGTTSLTNCTVSGNTGGVLGGGVYNGEYNAGTLTLTNCTISGNTTSYGSGGGVFNGGTATLSNCTLSGNSSPYGGGGLYNWNFFGGVAEATLTNCTVSGNSAKYGYGGGVMNQYGNNAATLTNCTVSGNSAALGGGVTNRSTLTLSNCTVSDNTGTSADDGGGGVRNTGTATLSNCTLSGNSSSYGGGLYNGFYAKATLTSCIVCGNSATGANSLFGSGGGGGGGVFNFLDSTIALTNCTVSGNSANGNLASIFNGGGGVQNTTGSTITLANCTLSGNSTNGSGGGVMNAYGLGLINGISSTATLTNCTVSGNSAGGSGGGIANQGSKATLTVASSKIIKNQATSTGGGISTTGGSATITDSDIKANLVNSSGNALGGGIYSAKSLLSLKNCTVSANQANGGAGASGVAGSDAIGGGLDAALGSTATITNTTFLGNSAHGGAGGNGADGGDAYGGAIAVTNTSSLSLSGGALLGDIAQGGAGGYGADGGGGYGGGLFVGTGGTATINQATFSVNLALGGDGLSGGDGEGGGCYVASGASVAATHNAILLNAAKGGHGHHAGSDGEGIGGGVFDLGTFTPDAATFILFNFASTSGDNIGS